MRDYSDITKVKILNGHIVFCSKVCDEVNNFLRDGWILLTHFQYKDRLFFMLGFPYSLDFDDEEISE